MPWPASSRRPEADARLPALLLGLATLAYPFLVWWGMARFEPRWLAALLAGMALLRAWSTREPLWWWLAAGAGALALVAAVGNQWLPIKLYPVLVSLSLLFVFGLSLRHPPTVIERLARLREPELPPHAVRYTRRVTQVWCGFFVLNAAISAFTALLADARIWAFYNGFLSYVLMGVLFAGEWLVRQRVKAAHG